MIGTWILVEGILSAMSSIKTEKASRTVSPKLVFSPESGFIQKHNNVSTDSITQGITMLYT